MHQGCVQQPYQDGCGGVLCFLHYPNLRKEVCGEEGGCGAVDDGGDDSEDNMDIPIPNMDCNHSRNSISNRSGMENPNRSMGRSNRSTSYTMVLPLRPMCRTSRLYTLAQPKPYRPKP